MHGKRTGCDLMNTSETGKIGWVLGMIVLAAALGSRAEEPAEETKAASAPPVEAFYTGPQLFSTAPNSQTVLVQSVDRFGPVGIGIELHPPAFVMKVKNVEPGSPAAAVGTLKPGQIIETINGQKLHDIDPRIQLGGIIVSAEATDGKVVFAVRDDKDAPLREIIVTIPVLGAYSKTWPLECPKSDTIVRNLANRFIRDGWGGGIGLDGPKMLFLLSTGDEGDLEVVRGWIKKTLEVNSNFNPGTRTYQWFVGWGAPPLAEYYLRTGDASVLPLMKQIADSVKQTQYHDGWGGRGIAGHHMGIAGTSTLTFLLLARQCGVDMDEGMLQSALRHFFRFSGKGVNPYPDIRPESTFTDNGRNGMLAFAMAAAAALTEDGEASLYAKARDISAFSSFASATYMLHGHTGGGIGEVWRSAAMGLMFEKKPEHYREFMDQRAWFYDLSRRFDGSFGVLGGASYDNEKWGLAMGLTYTAPRKKLCIFGAPRSAFAKTHPIPKQPWGTVGDNAFLSLETPADKDGTVRKLDGERLATDSGVAVDRICGDPNVTDEVLLKWIHHPLHRFREVAANAIYDHGRFHLIPELLKDKDPRIRNAGVMAIRAPRISRGNLVPGFPREKMPPEMAASLFEMLHDPNEAWFTVDKILAIIGSFSADELVPQADRLIHFLQQDEWWLRENALKAMAPLAADKRTSKAVLQAVEAYVPRFVRAPKGLSNMATSLAAAEPEIQRAGFDALCRVYLAYQGKKSPPPGGLHPDTEKHFLDAVAEAMVLLPGGFERLYEISRERSPTDALSHRPVFLANAGTGKYGDELNKAISQVVMSDLIPEFVMQNRRQLLSEIAWNKPGRPDQFAVGMLGGSGMKQGLSDLYRQAGILDYEWHAFGPERDKVMWDYLSFDPPEKQLWESGAARYRKVTLPPGMEDWYMPGFDTRKAGWKSGYAPIASVDGKLASHSEVCGMPYCNCAAPPNSLWEKEVLLMRGTFNLPPLDRTKRYRLLIGGRAHVGSGDGLVIYLNGTQIHEQKSGTGKRVGSLPCGIFIDSEMAKLFGNGGNVEIAVKAFLGRHPKSTQKKGYITLFFEEMNVPPINDIIGQAAGIMPLRSAAWQALQYPDVTPDDPDEGKFRYDGTFVANPKVVGVWTAVDQVASIDAFTAGKNAKFDKKKAPFSQLNLKENGETDNLLLLWSGDTLMDVDRGEALAMTVKAIGGVDYLFVESGGFAEKNGPEWKSPLLVFKRAGM